MSDVNAVLERLLIADQGRLRLGRRGGAPCGWSLVVLMREFLRREALWAGRLGVEGLPFVNLAHAVRPGFQCPPELLSRIAAFPQSSAERTCCQNLLGWYALKDANAGLVRTFDLPDPYEPLVRFFERGGAFSAEHRPP